MKESERKRKFNEFLHLSQEGILGSTEIAGKIGISINTLYNWRKRLRTETHPLQHQKSDYNSRSPYHNFLCLHFPGLFLNKKIIKLHHHLLKSMLETAL
jgi:hypothetical protein